MQKVAPMKQAVAGDALAAAGLSSYKDFGSRASEIFEVLCMLTRRRSNTPNPRDPRWG